MKKELFFLLIFSHFTTQGMEEKKFIAIPCMPDQPYKPNTLTRPKCITSEKWNEIPHHYPHVLHVTAKELEGLPLFAAQYSGKFSIQPLKLSLPSGKDPTKSYVQELFFIAEHTVNTADTSCEERLEQFLQNKSDQDILDYHVDLNYLNVSDSCKNNLICACHTRYQSLQKKLKKKNLSKNEKQTIETFCEYIKTSYMNTVQITESITDYVGYKKFLLKNTDDTHIGTIEKTPADGAILLQSSHIKYPEHIQFILDKLNTQKRLPKKHRYVALFDTPIAITLYNTNLKSLCLDTFFKYLPYISHITLKNHEQITITNQDLRTYAKHAINITFDNCTFKKSVGPFYTQHFYRMRRTPIITFKGKFTEEEKNSIIKNTKVPWLKKIIPIVIASALFLFEVGHVWSLWNTYHLANYKPFIWWKNKFVETATPLVKDVSSDALKTTCDTLLSDLSNQKDVILQNLWQIDNKLLPGTFSNGINLLLSTHAPSIATAPVSLLVIAAHLLLAKNRTDNAYSHYNDFFCENLLYSTFCLFSFYKAWKLYLWIKPKYTEIQFVK